MNTVNNEPVCDRIENLLKNAGVPYRMVEHAAEGQTELVSAARGNALHEAAKAMVVVGHQRKRDRQYYLAVVPGNCRIDFKAIRNLFNSSYVGLAPADKAEELTGCVMGSVPPFSFHSGLRLLVDRRLLSNSTIVFNAGSLDRSIYLAVRDYVAVAQPTVKDISLEE